MLVTSWAVVLLRSLFLFTYVSTLLLFYHLASMLLLPSDGSKRKVGGGAAAGMMSLDRLVDGDGW